MDLATLTQEARRHTATVFGPRPFWMNALMLFCIFMTFVYVPWDFFVKPVAEDGEVWFGFLFRGWAAKFAEPFHWAVYAAGTWGFWKMRRWMWPWASAYVAQVAFSMLVWNLINERGGGAVPGLVSALPFVVLSGFLWRARDRFDRPL